jgi:hypothetical protein
MPVQFLFLFVLLFVGGIALQRILTKRGFRITALWQVILAWIACYVFLAHVVWPPLPSHLFVTYLGAISLALFFFVSASEPVWTECKQSIRSLFIGETPAYRLLRAVVFVAAPTSVFAGLYTHMVPAIEAPIELRAYHPAPPWSFAVQGTTYLAGDDGYDRVQEEAEDNQSESITVHIPNHLIGLTEGHDIIRIKGSSVRVGDALTVIEEFYPRLYGQLRHRWDRTEPYVNFFVIDDRGRSLGSHGYYVGSQFRCCHADLGTEAPPGSDIYIVPVGYDVAVGAPSPLSAARAS